MPPRPHWSRPRDDELPTRRRSGRWDRIKLLLFFVGVFGVLVWTAMADDPLLPVRDALRQQVRSGAWVLALAAIELVRQIHYFICERSAPYHRFWSIRVFGGLDRRTSRINDYTRYRVGRALRWAIVVAVL